MRAAKLLQLCLSLRPFRLARQAPRSMGFSRQEYWSGWPSPPPDLPTSPAALALKVDSLLLSYLEAQIISVDFQM